MIKKNFFDIIYLLYIDIGMNYQYIKISKT